MITFLCISLFVTGALLVWAGYQIEDLKRHVAEAETAEHAKCIALIAEYVGDKFAYQVLTAAAEAYDTPGEVARAQMLGRNRRKDMASVPALWMTERGFILKTRAEEQAEQVREESAS